MKRFENYTVTSLNTDYEAKITVNIVGLNEAFEKIADNDYYTKCLLDDMFTEAESLFCDARRKRANLRDVIIIAASMGETARKLKFEDPQALTEKLNAIYAPIGYVSNMDGGEYGMSMEYGDDYKLILNIVRL